jgi:hypothetical protein
LQQQPPRPRVSQRRPERGGRGMGEPLHGSPWPDTPRSPRRRRVPWHCPHPPHCCPEPRTAPRRRTWTLACRGQPCRSPQGPWRCHHHLQAQRRRTHCPQPRWRGLVCRSRGVRGRDQALRPWRGAEPRAPKAQGHPLGVAPHPLHRTPPCGHLQRCQCPHRLHPTQTRLRLRLHPHPHERPGQGLRQGSMRSGAVAGRAGQRQTQVLQIPHHWRQLGLPWPWPG